MSRKTVILTSLFAAIVLATWGARTRPARADVNLANPQIVPQIEKIMGLIGNGKIDDAIAAMDSFKDHPEEREGIRGRLIEIGNSQQKYNGFDVIATQRYSERLEGVWVLAYYDQAPLMFQFVLYHPSGRADQPWAITAFHLREDVLEELKDVPVDYVGHAPR